MLAFPYHQAKADQPWTIPAVSLTPPWGSLMAAQIKRCETRSWVPHIPVPFYLAIHQTKGWKEQIRKLVESDHVFVDAVTRMVGAVYPRQDPKKIRAIFDLLPRGAVVAVARIYKICTAQSIRDSLSAQERHFGDYGNGRIVWASNMVFPLEVPIEASGKQSIWDW